MESPEQRKYRYTGGCTCNRKSSVARPVTAAQVTFKRLLLAVQENKQGRLLEKYITGVLISPLPDLFPHVFCLMVRIFRLMLVLLYIVMNKIVFSNEVTFRLSGHVALVRLR
jgi:hypothetical protein